MPTIALASVPEKYSLIKEMRLRVIGFIVVYLSATLIKQYYYCNLEEVNHYKKDSPLNPAIGFKRVNALVQFDFFIELFISADRALGFVGNLPAAMLADAKPGIPMVFLGVRKTVKFIH